MSRSQLVRLTILAGLVASSSLVVAQAPATQTQTPRAPTPVFTADDALEINTTAIADMTVGPVFVQNSKDPFLAWDDLRRMGNRRSVGELDAKTGAYKELIPEGMISSYTVADDGSVIAYTEDQSKKTDYEGNGGDGR